MAEESTVAQAERAPDVEAATAWIRLLSEEIGPRRPTSRAERIAAESMRAELARLGVDAEVEDFRGYATFGLPYGAILLAAVSPALLPPRRFAVVRSALAIAAAAALATEGSLRLTPLSRLLSRRRSANLMAAVEPRGEVRRTLCLVSHLDSSRSGALFRDPLEPRLGAWISLQSIAVLAAASEPLARRSRPGRAAVAAARAIAAAGLALVAERELRGVDVPGANDNASGVAVTARLLAEHADRRLEGTRLVFLATGCEEAGLLGMQHFLRSRDTEGWLFLNFDGVGGPATLRYLEREGVLTRWSADDGLLTVAGDLAKRRPDLGLEPAGTPAGLTYDATAVLARGGRAMTISAQDETIPNYHQPEDSIERIEREVLGRALEAGRELIAAVDRGDADQPAAPRSARGTR